MVDSETSKQIESNFSTIYAEIIHVKKERNDLDEMF